MDGVVNDENQLNAKSEMR